VHLEKVKEILENFDPITLEEMDSVKLMDRTDTKFVFSIQQLPSILEEIQKYYRSLEVSKTRMSKYETLYYDTDNFSLYQRHQSGKMNRYKIRSRKYVESNLHFFEVKFKNNKGRTIKSRFKTKEIELQLSEKAKNMIRDHTTINPETLKPKLWVNYTRITLVNKTSPERLTIDVGLQYIANEKKIDLSQLVIAEVKREKATSVSPIINTLRNKRIKVGSMSKYCFGIINMYTSVRKNNFKEKLRHINKITYAA
jgi:hypothetical protein